MSMHKKPLTPLEEEGLRLHGLDVGKPSQLSDVFRHGVAWAISQDPEKTSCESLRQRLAKYEDAEGRPVVAGDFAPLIRDLRNLAGVQSWASEPLSSAADALESQAREIHRLGLMVSEADFNYDQDRAQFERELATLKAQPSGVVLPDRFEMEPYQTVDKRSTNYKAGFNAAVKQMRESLNSSPVSAGVVDERAAFEAWYETTYGISLEPEFRANHFIGYVNDKANHRWTAWQARAALSAPSHGEQVRHMVMEGKIAVTGEALRTVLNALVNAPHQIRELQATREPVALFTDNPINVLIAEYEAAHAAPSAGSQEQG